MKKVKENCFGMFCVLISAIIAILVHALLPSPGASLSVDEFDGILVRKFGFPIVASFYFIVLYLHILIVIRSIGAKSTIPVLIWTLAFGMVMGGIYVLLRPIYEDSKGNIKNIQLLVWSVGVNWVWFNCFMGLILKGLFLKMFLRGGLDILVITIGCIVTRIILKRKGNCSEP